MFKIFEVLSLLFGYLEKELDKKAKVNFETYDITDWIANS